MESQKSVPVFEQSKYVPNELSTDFAWKLNAKNTILWFFMEEPYVTLDYLSLHQFDEVRVSIASHSEKLRESIVEKSRQPEYCL